MKTRRSAAGPAHEQPLLELPDAAALPALRAWHEGLSSHDAVARSSLSGGRLAAHRAP